MRALAYVLLVIGFLLLGASSMDEMRGVTHKPWSWLRRDRHYDRYLYRIPVMEKDNPILFRQFMRTHWIYAGAFEVVGIILLIGTWPKADEAPNP